MFYDRLRVEQYGVWEGRTVWRYTYPMRWGVWDRFITSIIPISFYTDFASVPRHFKMYDLYGGKCNAPASCHDYLYRKNAFIYVDLDRWPDNEEFPIEAEEWIRLLPDTGSYSNFPKLLADYIFRQLMIEDKENNGVYSKMYTAVKYVGESSFHNFNVEDELPCDRIYAIGEWQAECL